MPITKRGYYLKEPERVLRVDRNTLLEKTDWTQLPDALTSEKRADWAEYRQLLRDLPEVSTPTEGENNELLGVTWPTKPE